MARLRRCEFQGAIHLVTIKGYVGGTVFYDPLIFTRFRENPRGHAPNEEYFENLLWNTCEQYDAQVHAYLTEANAALIVIQTSAAPLSWIAHDLLTRFSVQLLERGQIPERTRAFPGRYGAQIVQPSKLPYAVRYVHKRGYVLHSHRHSFNHPFSSNLIYCGRRPRPKRFVVSAALEALSHLGYRGPNAYLDFMAHSDSPAIAHMLSQHVIGEQDFAEWTREKCQRPQRVPSPDEILEAVTATLLHTNSRVVCSSTRQGALARALVAWYAMRTGAARIGTVAAWFGVTSSDLRYLIRRHRPNHPEYFSVSLPELFPALSGQ